MDAFLAAQIPAALGRLQRETDMFLATVDSLSDDEMAVPSKCDGWTRAHVVTHVARSADAMCNLVEWARTGVEKPAYESERARTRAIEEGARRPARAIAQDVREACARFAGEAQALTGVLAVDEVAVRGATVDARHLPVTRMTEVIVHHDDLDTVWELAEADIDAQLDALEEAVRLLRLQNGVPAFTIRTVEKDEWTFGSGGPVVRGERDAVLAWLARGDTSRISCDFQVPEVSAFQ